MIKVNHRKKREFEEIISVDDVIELLKTSFKDKDLHMKFSLEKSDVKIIEFLDDRSIMLVADPDFIPENNSVTVYGLLDKYIEIDMSVEEVRGPGYFKCKIEQVRRAKNVRKDVRFNVDLDEVVATNFKVSKHTIDISSFRVPTSIKVILDQFQSKNSKLADIVKVGVFEYGDVVLDEIKKTSKTIFVEDVSNSDSYKAITEDFLDLNELYGDELKVNIQKNVERGYKSIIISPIIYLTESGQSFPFAYIQFISKGNFFTIEKVLEVKELSFSIVDRIRDANTILLAIHQRIVDISRNGAKLKVEDENLKKYLARSKGFIFDIVFKLQAPITVFGEIRCTYFDEEGNMYVGVDFEGNSSRQDEMKRFSSMIDPMIKGYKNRLLKKAKERSK